MKILIFGSCKRSKEIVEHEAEGSIVNSAIETVLKELMKEAGITVNQRENRDHLNYNICEIGQNTQNSPGDAQLPLEQRIHKMYINNNNDRDHSNHSSSIINKKSKKSPVDLSRFAIIWTSTKIYQLELVWKPHE